MEHEAKSNRCNWRWERLASKYPVRKNYPLKQPRTFPKKVCHTSWDLTLLRCIQATAHGDEHSQSPLGRKPCPYVILSAGFRWVCCVYWGPTPPDTHFGSCRPRRNAQRQMKSLMTRIQTTANEGGSQFLSTLPWTDDRTSTCVWAQDSLHCNILSPGSRANTTRIHAVKPRLIEASKFRPRSFLVLVKLPPQVLAARQILQTLQGHASRALLVAPGLEHRWSKGSQCSLISGQFMPGVLLCSGSWRFGIMAFDLKST